MSAWLVAHPLVPILVIAGASYLGGWAHGFRDGRKD
jgi:hypothetical protein